jgi:diguanylate cyclase
MSVDLEIVLRGPVGFSLARKTLDAMEAHQVSPTPQNFELWLHFVGSKGSPLGLALTEIVAQKTPFTDAVADDLAATHLPKARLNGEILDAGTALSKELDSVSKAIESARETNDAYDAELASASQTFGQQPEAIKAVVETLATATQKVRRETKTLESQLADTTAEVTRLREHLEVVRREAMTDGLTNLANRRAFDEALARAISVAGEPGGHPVSLAIIDIDHFKVFNDNWGHQTGDQVLRYVASVIGRAGHGRRTAARFGGEEFALIMPGEDARAALPFLEQIREEVGSRVLKRRSTDEDLGAVNVSIGLAEHSPGEKCAALLERADAALYASKRGGRNRTTIAEPARNGEAEPAGKAAA